MFIRIKKKKKKRKVKRIAERSVRTLEEAKKYEIQS